MLMHYIYDNQLMPKVATYFDLHENKHVPVEDAIQQAFGMSAPQFDKALRSYVSSGHYMYYSISTPAKIASNDYTVTPLSAVASNAVLADIHLHSRDYQERALNEFQDILKSDPNSAVAYRGLGYAYLQKGNFNQAAEYFKRASQLDSKDPRVHYYNALLMARKNGFSGGADLPTMTKELESSISLDPNFADSYALLAMAQSGSGDPAKALATMQKALAISPRNENYLFNLANLYLAARHPDQAIALLQSLQASANPEMASRAAGQLTLAQQFKEMGDAPEVGITPRLIVRNNPPEETVSEPARVPVPSAPAQFVRGTLTNVDCSTPPFATLTVVSGAKTWKMKVTDTSHVILIGADEFSCA
jgi:tetratricopeptide (TPR) repeat protein